VNSLDERVQDHENRIRELEEKMAKKDTEFAVINTKLSAILWGVGATATALLGVLAKMILGG
jgi:chaperonin cofactor prefoldin